MNDRMHKMKMGLVLVECLFFVLFFEDEAINGSEVGILPNGQRRVRQGPTLNIEVQLKPTTIVFVLKKEYGGKGVGWLGNRRETILGMDGFFGEKVTAWIQQQGQSAGWVSVKGIWRGKMILKSR